MGTGDVGDTQQTAALDAGTQGLGAQSRAGRDWPGKGGAELQGAGEISGQDFSTLAS